MKNLTTLLTILFICTVGFSQNKIGGDNPKIGQQLLDVPMGDMNRSIKNPEKNPLIDQISELEFEYLNLKAKEVQYEFINQDLTKLKTKDEVFKEYINYLKKKITEIKPKLTKAVSHGSTRSNREGIINTEIKPTIKKAKDLNINTSRSNKKQQ